VHRTHYLHGYHEAVPPMAPIALLAPMARSTNRSTAAAPDPFVLLLYVTSPAAPAMHPREVWCVRSPGLAECDREHN
jgi:hypothetical protein